MAGFLREEAESLLLKPYATLREHNHYHRHNKPQLILAKAIPMNCISRIVSRHVPTSPRNCPSTSPSCIQENYKGLTKEHQAFYGSLLWP